MQNLALDKGRRTFVREGARICIDFEEILSHVHGNFDDQNKVLEPPITIITHCTIIIIIIIIIINAVKINIAANCNLIFLLAFIF